RCRCRGCAHAADSSDLREARSRRSPLRHRNGTEPLPTPRRRAAKVVAITRLRRRRILKHFVALTAIAIAAVFTTSAAATSKGVTLKGAGSTFVSPLVQTWQQPYESATGVHVDYNPIGSGGGIQAITNRSVDFGASDAPLTADQFNACNGCVQIPWALAGTAIPYNVPGITPASAAVHLHLSGDVIA